MDNKRVVEEETNKVVTGSGSDYTTQERYFALFKRECDEEYDLTFNKNRDYAGAEDAFQNFKAIEFLTRGNISVEEGILVRMTDKFQRVINLLAAGGEPHVKDEKITDTLRDLSVYAKILKIYISTKDERQ